MAGIDDSSVGDLYSTGGQVDFMTMALIDSAFDKEESVRKSVSNALFELGKKQCELVLSSCQDYLKRHQNLAQGHRVVLLEAMEKICKEKQEEISPEMGTALVQLGIAEMTMSKEVIPEWQESASALLVSLGRVFCKEIMDCLLERFQPGQIPHFFVIHTMAQLAQVNSTQMVPYLSGSLGTMLPMMGMAKGEGQRWVFAATLAKFSEAILDYLANVGGFEDSTVEKDATITLDSFSQEIFAAYEVLFNVWLKSSEGKLRLAIVESIGYMSKIIAKEKLEEQLPKLFPALVALLKKHADNPAPITQGLCMVLEAATADSSLMLEPMVEMLLNSLFPIVCQSIDYNNVNQMKSHNEVLRCIAVLAGGFMDKVVTFLMSRLQNNNEKIRIGTLTCFRHLINFFGSDQITIEKKAVILSALKVVLMETNNKVKKIFSQVVIAMGNHDYLQLEGGKSMIEFLVKQCALDPKGGPPAPAGKNADPEYVSNAALKNMCENILQLMTTTIGKMEKVLWPRLIEYVVPESYDRAVTAVAKSVAHLGSLKRERIKVRVGSILSEAGKEHETAPQQATSESETPDEKAASESETAPEKEGKSDEDDDDYYLNYEVHVDLPRPYALLSRCLVLLGHPLENNDRGPQLLAMLQALSSNIHPSVVEMWDTVIPKLKAYLEESEDGEDGPSFNQKTWEDLVLKMLSKSLELIDNQEWVVELGNTLASHIPMYSSASKSFLFKCMGIVARKSLNTNFVKQNLDSMIAAIDHDSQEEREGAAIALGFCATSHLDVVLTKLEATLKPGGSTAATRKGSGLFSFGRDKSEPVSPKTKITVMLAYGYVALYSPPDLIVSRIETDILRVITAHLASQEKKPEKDPVAKLNMVKTIDLIGKTLHPSHLKTEYYFTNRSVLMSKLLEWLKIESAAKTPSFEIFAAILSTCVTLVRLSPPLTDADICELAQTTTAAVYSLPSGILDSDAAAKFDGNSVAGTTEDVLKLVDELLFEILKTSTNATTLEKIYGYLEKWISTQEATQRFRALNTISNMLSCYTEAVFLQAVGSDRIIHPAAFDLSIYGTALAHFVPRFCDPEVSVRHAALDSICKLLTVQVKCSGGDPEADNILEGLMAFKERLDKSDPNSLFSLVNDLSKVVVRRTPTKQLWLLLEGLMSGLLDEQPHASSAACVVLNALIRNRGLEMASRVDALLKLLHVHLARVTHPQTRTGTLRALRTLAAHCLEPVLTQLLTTFPIPYDESIVACWQVLVSDAHLSNAVLEHLLSILNKSLPFEERREGGSSQRKAPPTRIASELPLHATCALTQIFKVPEMGATLKDHFPRVLSALILRIGVTQQVILNSATKDAVITDQQKQEIKSVHKISSPNVKISSKDYAAVKVSVDALKAFLEHEAVECGDVIAALDDTGAFDKFVVAAEQENALSALAAALTAHKPDCIPDLTSQLSQGLCGPYDNQRIAIAAVFAELINQNACGDEKDLAFLVSTMLGRMVDSERAVRRLVTRGLGNMANCRKDMVERYLTTILSALISAMDDKDDPEDQIALAAMEGLAQVLGQVEEGHVRGILINIALRIRPCLAKDSGRVRAAAFALFGALSRFGNGPSSSTFLEQIHSNLVTMLLHLNDENEDVIKATKGALRKIGPLIGSESVDKMFQTLLLDDRSLHYGEFINDLSKCVIADFPEKLNFYVMNCVGFFKSEWVSIRTNAVVCAGFLLGNLQNPTAGSGTNNNVAVHKSSISKEHVCSALMSLLKDSDPGVRSAAAEAISLLHSY